MRGLLLSIDDDVWAVRLEQVHEVIASPALTAIPGAPPALLGVCNRRGDVLPVLSLPSVLGTRPPAAAERSASWVAVLATRAGPAGIAVTRLPEVVELGGAAAATEPPWPPWPPSFHRADGDGGPQSIALLDPDAVFTPARLAGQR